MTVAIDLPPLIWHAELGAAARRMDTNHRGVQLSDTHQNRCVGRAVIGSGAQLRSTTPRQSRPGGQTAAGHRAVNGAFFPTAPNLTGRWLRSCDPQRLAARHTGGEDRKVANKPSDVSSSSDGPGDGILRGDGGRHL